MKSPMTADMLYEMHRLALRGVSSATGATLPAKLEDCPVGAQAAHYAMACFAARELGFEAPDAPHYLPREEAERVRSLVYPGEPQIATPGLPPDLG